MARNLFPQDSERLYLFVNDTDGFQFARGAAGDVVHLYLDPDATHDADIRLPDGSVPFPPGQLIVDDHSRIPRFLGPDTGEETLYARVDLGPIVEIHAQIDSRVNNIKDIVEAVQDVADKFKARLDLIETAATTLQTTTQQLRNQAVAAVNGMKGQIDAINLRLDAMQRGLDGYVARIVDVETVNADLLARVEALEAPVVPVDPPSGGGI